MSTRNMVPIISTLWNWINDAAKLIVPQRCAICRRRLRKYENHICIQCFTKLPLTHIKGVYGNKVEQIFWGQIPICRANAFMLYQPQSETSHIFFHLKYMHRPQIGDFFGEMMAQDLADTDFFDGIDAIIPLPLAKDRLRKRGYNQSEHLAIGVQHITHIPIDTSSVLRVISNPTQTRLNAKERAENVKNIFALSPHHNLNGKHILLIDDILTTGSTLLSCAKEIAKANNVKISILVLGLAKEHFAISRNFIKEENTIG